MSDVFYSSLWRYACLLQHEFGKTNFSCGVLCSSYQWNCDRNVLYAGYEYGSLDYIPIFHLQGQSKLQFFLTHYRKNDTKGELLKTSLQYTQLEYSLKKPFFEHNFYKVSHLTTPTWLTNLWQYCNECIISIHEHIPWQYNAPRDFDFFLMDEIINRNVSNEKKEISNQVRMHLQILTASDIVIVSHGNRILPDILRGVNKQVITLNR